MEKISNATDLITLKKEVLEGNFNKYFKDCFTQKDFQNKWFELYYYRNKIAHNGSFDQQEVAECFEVCSTISEIIDTAYEKLDTFKLSASDREALVSAVNEYTSDALQSECNAKGVYKTIDEETLLSELSDAVKSLPFVALKHFVIEWLGKKGYAYDASYTLVNYLVDKGLVELRQVDNPKGTFPTTAIDFPASV